MFLFPRFKKEPIQPVNLTEFRKHLKNFLIFQGLAAIIPILLDYRGHQSNRLDLQFYAVAVSIILQLIAITLLFRARILGRLKDIYPNLVLSRWKLLWLSFVWISPISSILTLSFLSLKKHKSTSKKIPLILRYPIFSGLLWGTLVLSFAIYPYWIQKNRIQKILYSIIETNQSNHPKDLLILSYFHYWFFNPSLYYISSILDEAITIFELKQTIDSNSNIYNIDLLETFSKTHRLTTTGKILIISIIVSEAQRQSKFDIHPIKNKKIQILKDFIQIINVWDHQSMEIFRYNPISKLFPISALEASLLDGVSLLFEAKFLNQFIPKTSKLYSISETSDDPQIEELQRQFKSTRTYYQYDKLQSTLINKYLK